MPTSRGDDTTGERQMMRAHVCAVLACGILGTAVSASAGATASSGATAGSAATAASMATAGGGPNIFVPQTAPGDFDGDLRSDMTVYQSDGTWRTLKSSGSFTASLVKSWGGAG